MDFLLQFALKDEKEILEELKTSNNGLNEEEARQRLKEFGENKIQTLQIDLWEIIKRNSFNFFNLFLLVAALLSLAIEGTSVETKLIFFFLFFSIFLAIFQDYRANKLTERLLSYFTNYTFVKRDNRWKKIESKSLVPGDYVKIVSGSLVPADIRILKAEDVLVNESVVTGESDLAPKSSIYQEKTLLNIALMGTTVARGELEGIVLATGKRSYFGSLTKKILDIKKETAYGRMMNDFAKNIGYVALLIALSIIFVKIVIKNYESLQELIIFTIVLAVAVVPEFLPTMNVLAMSLAGIRLSKKGLIIKRLSAIEDLGAINVLCTDKTGTLTTNELEVKRIITQEENDFIKYFLADYYFTQELTSYEKAIINFSGYEIDWYKDWELIEEIEFDPIKRMRKIIIKNKFNSEIIKINKGAPEEIIKDCQENLSESNIDWLKIFREEDEQGLRTLALAINNQFWGIASFVDPLKKTALAAVHLAKTLNVEIKILTGDSPNVAKAVAIELGLITKDDKVILGEEMRNLDEKTFSEIIKKTKVFARVLPEDKLKIIQSLQKENFVGFLGEGINDAPALKAVNVALVVDSAADVTKQEADIILKEKDLKTIVEGINQGRKTLENIGKYIKHTMSDNVGNLTSVAFLTSFLSYIPLAPIQVLLTNFLTDIPLIAFANDNVEIREIRKPVKISIYHLILLLLILGTIAGLINILGFFLVKDKPVGVIRTYIFLLTTLTGLLVSFSIRTKDWFFKSKPSLFFSFISIIALVTTIIFVFNQFFAQIFNFQSLERNLILQILFLLILFLFLTEIAKKIFYKKFNEVI